MYLGPQYPMCLISIHSHQPRPNFTVAKVRLFRSEWCYWNKALCENAFCMAVNPMWSESDNWTLKQCYKSTAMAHGGSQNLAEWCLQNDYMVMICHCTGYYCTATRYIIFGPGSRPGIPYCVNIGMKLIYITGVRYYEYKQYFSL